MAYFVSNADRMFGGRPQNSSGTTTSEFIKAQKEKARQAWRDKQAWQKEVYGEVEEDKGDDSMALAFRKTTSANPSKLKATASTKKKRPLGGSTRRSTGVGRVGEAVKKKVSSVLG